MGQLGEGPEPPTWRNDYERPCCGKCAWSACEPDGEFWICRAASPALGAGSWPHVNPHFPACPRYQE